MILNTMVSARQFAECKFPKEDHISLVGHGPRKQFKMVSAGIKKRKGILSILMSLI